MAAVRYTYEEMRKLKDRTDWAKVAATTEEDIQRYIREDDSDTSQMGEPRFVPAIVDVRALRDRLGLSRSEFARRYLLSVRTVQQWEQERREPSESARILLYATSVDPAAMDGILNRGRIFDLP